MVFDYETSIVISLLEGRARSGYAEEASGHAFETHLPFVPDLCKVPAAQMGIFIG